MTNRSEITVSRPVERRAIRSWISWTTAVLCVLGAARSSQASGCHAHDRPVVSHTLSWETDQVVQLQTTALTPPPSVLTHPRCGDEILPTSGDSVLPPVPALANEANFAPPDLREWRIGHPRLDHLQPAAIRLDRPPRAASSRLLS